MSIRQGAALLLLAAIVASPVAAAQATAPSQRFEVRGIKGLWWDGIEKYKLAMPWLAKHNLNFLMLCYSSFDASGRTWREDYKPQELRDFAVLARQGDRLGVRLCLSFNPGIWSNPPLEYSSEKDYALALRKVKQVHAAGIRWFGLCLDDINRSLTPADQQRFGTLEEAQVYFVNRLYRDMMKLKPAPVLIFCPSAYTTGEAEAHDGYIRTIGTKLDRRIKVFWTGPQVCSPSITAADARKIAGLIGRKPFVWDNYPVNDMFPWRPLVSPVKNRSADLAGEVSGFMANPMKQWHISAIPLATLADYLNRPASYDPARSIEKAINSYPSAMHTGIRMLVDLYGSSFWGDPAFPPKPAYTSKSQAAADLLKYRLLKKELSSNPALAEVWKDVQPTLDEDIRFLERKSRDRSKTSPLKAEGDEFAGGAGELYGYSKFGRSVNYVYAANTGRNEMSVPFYVPEGPARAYKLRLVAMNDDWGSVKGILIRLGPSVLYSGASPFVKGSFTEQFIDIAEGDLLPGENLLTISVTDPEGQIGNPPWFMVAEAELIPASGN